MKLLPEQPQRCKIADVNDVECVRVNVSLCGESVRMSECVCMCLRCP